MISSIAQFIKVFHELCSFRLEVEKIWHILNDILGADAEAWSTLALQKRVDSLPILQTEFLERDKSLWKFPVHIFKQQIML